MSGPAVAYLGPSGTFTHQAVVSLRPGAQAVPVGSQAEALALVEAGSAAYAVLPIDNSVNGVVVPTLDGLLERPDLSIVDSAVVAISFTAFTRDPAVEAHVVVSHPHALAQCRAWIEARGLATREASSTAAACRDLGPGEIGIGPAICGSLYGLHTVETAVEDNAAAYTQFALVSASPLPVEGDGDDGLLVTIAPDANVPGILRRLLGVLEERGINMTNLVTRPVPSTPGIFVFLLFLSGTFTADEFAEMREEWARLGGTARAVGRISPLAELVGEAVSVSGDVERVAVVGAGLIGGSLALRLHGLGRVVTVVDPDPATRAAAAGAGLAVAEATPADADVVVLAVPLDVLAAAMREVATAAPSAVVIDVGSVKQAPARAAREAGLGERYVGCHPMAGTEHTGFEHADADLLVGATWAVTHTGGLAATARVAAWVVADFAATVVLLDPAEHDRSVALVSHAPHAVAHALLALAEGDAAPDLAGLLAAGSFRDGTRVAGRNPTRTANMLLENAAALGPALDGVLAELTALRAELADPAALRARLERVAAETGPVRVSRLAYAPCPSLSEAVAAARRDGGAVAVRRRAGALEVARLRDAP